MLRGILRREHPTYWTLQRDAVLNCFTAHRCSDAWFYNGIIHWGSEPSKHLCRRYMRSTECPSSFLNAFGGSFFPNAVWGLARVVLIVLSYVIHLFSISASKIWAHFRMLPTRKPHAASVACCDWARHIHVYSESLSPLSHDLTNKNETNRQTHAIESNTPSAIAGTK